MPAIEVHRFVLRLALSGAHIFSWIFIFQHFFYRSGSYIDAVAGVALTYALTQLVVVLLTPWAARFTKYGVRRGMTLALVCSAFAFVALGAGIGGVLSEMSYGVMLFAVLMGAYRAFYWTPYSVSGASRTNITFEILVALMPAFVGVMLSQNVLSLLAMPFAAAFLCLLAIVPTRFMANAHERFAWSYRETFQELFSDDRRGATLHAFLDGIEGAALLLLWPLAVFMLLGWSYLLFGAVMAITLLATFLLRGFRVKYLGSIRSPHVHALFIVSAWAVRLTAAGPLAVVLVDMYQAGVRPFSRGVEEATGEQAADNRTYIDEHTALKEMAQALGRLSLCLIAVAIAGLGSVPLVFFACFCLAAVAALTSVYVMRRTPQEAF